MTHPLRDLIAQWRKWAEESRRELPTSNIPLWHQAVWSSYDICADQLDAALTADEERMKKTWPELRDNGKPNKWHEFELDHETGCCVICGWAEAVHVEESALQRTPQAPTEDVCPLCRQSGCFHQTGAWPYDKPKKAHPLVEPLLLEDRADHPTSGRLLASKPVESQPARCFTQVWSSRTCERGTFGCNVEHDASQPATEEQTK